MSKRLAFLIDTRYCNNCKTCEIACKMERKLPIGTQWRKVRHLEVDLPSDGMGGQNNPLTVINIPMSCNHCEKPACVQICPQNAYRKTPEGPVIQKQYLCIGCSKCVSACPYTAPVYNPTVNKTGKCDMCYDRIKAGMNPYCVECCPNNALKFGEYEDLVAAYGVKQDLSEDLSQYGVALGHAAKDILPDPAETNPSIVIVTCKNDN